jgi:hypothetical protein
MKARVALIGIALITTACGSTPTAQPKVATLSTPSSTAAESATSASQTPPAEDRPRFRMDMTDQEKQDLYRVYLKCMQDHGVNVMADRDGSTQTDKVTAEKAQKVCDSKLPLPAWEEDATNPEAMDFAREVVDCLRAKGVKKVEVSTNDGIVGPALGGPENDQESINKGMDLTPVCQREVFKQK